MSFLAILLGEELHSVWMSRVWALTGTRPRVAGTSGWCQQLEHQKTTRGTSWWESEVLWGELQKWMAIAGWVLISSQRPACVRCTVLATGVELQTQELVCPGASYWGNRNPGTASGQTVSELSYCWDPHWNSISIIYMYINIGNLTLYKILCIYF